jgi:hypothetical protein
MKLHRHVMTLTTALTATALWGVSGSAADNTMVFNRIASFPVNTNLPADADQASETSAEIIYVTEDGMTLVYSDSPFAASA